MDTSSLNQLKDVHLPPPPSIFPLAPGWSGVMIITLLVLGTLLFFIWRILQHKQQLNEINQLLDHIELNHYSKDNSDTLAELSVVLKRVAILRLSQYKPHALFGREWLIFLDQHGKTTQFSNGIGQILENVYQKNHLADPKALFAIVRQWIRTVL